MSKTANLLVGPELLCFLFYLLILMIIKFSGSPVKSMDSFWVSQWFIIPLVFIPLAFALYYAPGVIRNWLLLRIWIVGIVGGHFLMNRSMQAHSEQGPGVGTAYMVGMGFIFVMLIAGNIWAAVKFR